MTSRADNFNRADTTNNIGTPSDAGSAWSQQSGTWGINTNRAYESASSAQATCVLEASSAIVDVQTTIGGSISNGGLVVRAADDSNYIVGTYNPTVMEVYKKVAGTFTQLGSTFSGTIAAGDVLLLSVDGSNNIVWKQNGTARVTTSDAAGSANTKHGIRSNANTSDRFDDFTITDNSGGAAASQGIILAPSLDGLGSYGIFRGNRPS